MTKKKEVKIESGIPSVSLLVKKGFEKIKIPFQTIKKFFTLIKTYRKADDKEKYFKDEKAALKELLIKIVSRFPSLDLLALQTEKDNLRTAIFESVTKTITYNREPLKKSLGEAYPGIVLEDLQMTILLTPEAPQEEVIKALKKLLGEDVYKKLVDEEITLRVDDDKLMEMVAQKKVTLEKEARVVEEERVWSVKTSVVKT